MPFQEQVWNLYREYIDDEWYSGYAGTLVDVTGHTPTESERIVAFLTWAAIVHRVGITFDDIDAVLYGPE